MPRSVLDVPLTQGYCDADGTIIFATTLALQEDCSMKPICRKELAANLAGMR
jgi:hypothetical protein